MVHVLIERDAIARRVLELAREIERDTPGGASIHLVAVLKGAFVFLSDLVRAFDDRVSMDFIAVSSYGSSTSSSGEVRLVKDVDTSLEGRHVVIVEDIVDTGLTLHYLQDILRRRRPASLRTAFPQWRAGRTADDEHEYVVLQASENGQPVVNLYFDESGMLTRLVLFTLTPVGFVPTQIDYSDFRDVAGVKVPFKKVVSQTFMRMTVESSEVQPNVAIDAARFAQPR